MTNILFFNNFFYLEKEGELNTFAFHNEREAREFVALGVTWQTKKTIKWTDISEGSRYFWLKRLYKLVGQQTEGVLHSEDEDSLVWGNGLPKTELTLEELKAL